MSDELAEASRKLVERALREEPQLPTAGVERIRRNVLVAGAGAVLAAGSGKAAVAGGFSALVGPALKGVALGAVVAAGVHVGQQVLQSREPARSDATAVSAPHSAAGTASGRMVPGQEDKAARGALPVATASIPSSAVPSTRSVPFVAAKPSASAAPRSLSEELAVLERAQRALAAGDSVGALRVLDEGQAALGHGSLRQERLAAEVLAACAAGDVARARRAAHLFLAVDSGTPTALRVRASCAGDPEGTAR